MLVSNLRVRSAMSGAVSGYSYGSQFARYKQPTSIVLEPMYSLFNSLVRHGEYRSSKVVEGYAKIPDFSHFISASIRMPHLDRVQGPPLMLPRVLPLALYSDEIHIIRDVMLTDQNWRAAHSALVFTRMLRNIFTEGKELTSHLEFLDFILLRSRVHRYGLESSETRSLLKTIPYPEIQMSVVGAVEGAMLRWKKEEKSVVPVEFKALEYESQHPPFCS